MVNKKEDGKEDLRYAFSISGFVLGILSIVFLGINGIFMGIIGMIFSSYSYKKEKTRIGKIGIILNLIGIIVGIVLFIFIVFFAGQLLSLQSI